MLGKIIFARRFHSHDAPLPFIVVGVTSQYEEGTTYTVLAEHDDLAFEPVDIFVSNGYRSNSWEILGVTTSRQYVENKIKRLNSMFIENALRVEWTDETVATAIDTIQALERAAAALDSDSAIDEEFDAFGADVADSDDDETEVITDEEADELEARDAGRAAHAARERQTQEALAGRDVIPVVIIEMPEAADTAEQLAAKVQADIRRQRADILRRLGVGQ